MSNNLRGVVLGAYPSISAFARDIQWDRKKASRIINGNQDPSTKDIREIVELLNIRNADDFLDIFFSGMSTMQTKMQDDPLYFAMK